ncbi:hypothetical protein BDV12DRAFT_174923 [Aspergillus spectabilis]
MSLHWPLERLQLSGVCGEVSKSPHILRGRLHHLTLYITPELGFEGPISAELSRAYHAAIEGGETEAQYLGKRCRRKTTARGTTARSKDKKVACAPSKSSKKTRWTRFSECQLHFHTSPGQRETSSPTTHKPTNIEPLHRRSLQTRLPPALISHLPPNEAFQRPHLALPV